MPVYAFSLYDLGVNSYAQSIQELAKIYHLDTVVLVDAGTFTMLPNYCNRRGQCLEK